MKTILVALTAMLLGAGACRERPDRHDRDRVSAGKPVETDRDFAQTRKDFETSVRERLDQIDKRIDELESRADSAGHNAAVQLRARRDELVAQSKQISKQAQSGWDRFEQSLSKSLDQLEHDLDRLAY